MNNYIASISIAATLLASSAAAAEISANGTKYEMNPLQALTIRLPEHTAVVYYVVQESGDYQIVTTIGPNAGVVGNASQHRITMSEGQSWSLDMENGRTTTTITFSANEESLFVASQ